MNLDFGLPQNVLRLPKRAPSIPSAVEPVVPGPLEAKMRAVISNLKGTKYPDAFDWSVYDKIAARFGESQPRGGVVFNTALKLVNHHASCTKCHYAFEIDCYGRGCIHNCAYCYAKETLSAHGYWNRPMPFPVNLAEVRKVFYTVFETDRPSTWREILEKRVPLRIGSMSDSFMWMDRKYRVAQELLRILNFYNYPHIIFTRSDLIAEDEYLSILRKDLASIQMSISGGNESITRAIEPGAATVERRLSALRKLAENGYWTTVRINPFFPMYPDGYFTDQKSIEERFGSYTAVPKFELFDWSFISQLKDAKVPSVLAGVVRLSPVALKAMSQATGIDLKLFYRPELSKGNFDRKYSESEITYYYMKLQAVCARSGIRFSTCYIGNGEKSYFQHQSLWDNKLDCCDAKGNVPSFVSSSQDISWEMRSKQSGHRTDAEKLKAQDKEIEEAYASLANENMRLGLRVVPPAQPKTIESVGHGKT